MFNTCVSNSRASWEWYRCSPLGVRSRVQRSTRHILDHFRAGLHSQSLTDTDKQNSTGKYANWMQLKKANNTKYSKRKLPWFRHLLRHSAREWWVYSTMLLSPHAAIRLVTDTRRSEHMIPVLRQLHWLSVCQCINFKIATLVHRSLSGISSLYLADDCHVDANATTMFHSESNMHWDAYIQQFWR